MMANFIFNEVICFVPNHLFNVPPGNILVIISSFYDDDELVKAKVILHDICIEFVKDCEITRIITNSKKVETKNWKQRTSLSSLLYWMSRNLQQKNCGC